MLSVMLLCHASWHHLQQQRHTLHAGLPYIAAHSNTNTAAENCLAMMPDDICLFVQVLARR
jgi:hypothetical protein